MAVPKVPDVGDVLRISVEFRNSAIPPVLTNPTAVTCSVRRPDGTVLTPGAVNDSVGKWHVDVALSAAGTWDYRVVGTGVLAAADQGSVVVRKVLV